MRRVEKQEKNYTMISNSAALIEAGFVIFFILFDDFRFQLQNVFYANLREKKTKSICIWMKTDLVRMEWDNKKGWMPKWTCARVRNDENKYKFHFVPLSRSMELFILGVLICSNVQHALYVCACMSSLARFDLFKKKNWYFDFTFFLLSSLFTQMPCNNINFANIVHWILFFFQFAELFLLLVAFSILLRSYDGQKFSSMYIVHCTYSD